MTKQRFLVTLFAVLIAGVMLTGCGNNTGKAEEAIKTDKPAKTDEEAEKSLLNEDGGSGDTANADSQAENETGLEDAADLENAEETEIQVFIAASLNTVMTKLAEQYQIEHPQIKITYNADSSGTLLTQIQEGYECDIFFSAAEKQMDQLEADGLVVEGTREKVVNNQVVVVTLKDSGTKVTGLENLGESEIIALAGGSVPVGKYTRQALVNLSILEEAEDVSAITTQQVSEALGGVEISEQDNVGKVLTAVLEGSCEVGTTYYSDTYGYEDDLEILQTVSCDLTGNVIYPIAQVVNDEADETQAQAAKDFISFILTKESKKVFEEYYFDTNVS